MNFPTPLVSCAWLQANLDNPRLVILEARLKPIGITDNSNPDIKIGKALLFDIDHNFSDLSNPLPHTLPTEAQFTEEAQRLGLRKDDFIVIYDRFGVYASPRAWWLFRVMGHERVAVLNGGLPAWIQADLPTESVATNVNLPKGDFQARLQARFLANKTTVLEAINQPNQAIIDARSEARFKGEVPEPRPHLRSGHIPSALNVPFQTLWQGAEMRSPEELSAFWETKGVVDKSIIFSCGSGVTACVLALGATVAGLENWAVYDGSWSEWGLPADLPIEKP